MAVEGSSEVPLVDLRGLSSAECDLQEIATQIHHAFTTIGFVAVMNHNITQKEVDEAWIKWINFSNFQAMSSRNMHM